MKAGNTVKHDLVNMAGKNVGSIELDAAVFDVKPQPTLVHETVRWQLAKRRSGTHSALTRSQVKGSGKKPYKQKGTGRARVGTHKSPVRVGGGVAHGPAPRDYSYKLPKRTRRQALCSVLSEKRGGEQLLIIDDLKIESGKTRDMADVLQKVGVQRGAVVVTDGDKASEETLHLTRATRNLENVTLLTVAGLNVYDVMKRPYLVCSKPVIEMIQARLNGSETEKAA